MEDTPVTPSAERQMEVSPLKLQREPLTFGRVFRFLLTLALVIILPLLATVTLGVYQIMFPTRVHSALTLRDAGPGASNVLLTTADKVNLTGWFVPARKGSDRAILVLHGYPADKGDILRRVQFLSDDYNLLFIDFRSFGGSVGDFTTYGALETRDARAGIDWLKAQGYAKIGVYGYNMGGAVALLMLPDQRVDAVVAESSYADLTRVLDRSFEYVGPVKHVCTWIAAKAAEVILNVDIAAVSPVNAVAATQKPLLLIDAVDDLSVPVEDSFALRTALANDPNGAAYSLSGTDDEKARGFVKNVRAFFRHYFDGIVPTPAAGTAPQTDQQQ